MSEIQKQSGGISQENGDKVAKKERKKHLLAHEGIATRHHTA